MDKIKKFWSDWGDFITLVLFLIFIIFFINYFFFSKRNENRLEIYKRQIDSLKRENEKVISTNNLLEKELKNKKIEEKVIIQNIYENDKKIDKIKSIPSILPDTSNYKFFSEFKTDIEN